MNKKILTNLTLLASLSSLPLVANDLAIDRVGFHLGWQNTYHSKDNENGVVVVPNKANTHFKALEVFTTLNGVFDRDDLKPYFSYTHSFLNDEISHKYILGGVNKYYQYNDDITLYAGVFTGYGKLDWEYNPITNTSDNKYSANSFNLGLQGGLEYPLQDNLSLSFNAKYMIHEYDTTLQPDSTTQATLTHDKTNFLGLGLVYRFESKKVKNQPKEEKPVQEKPKPVQKQEPKKEEPKDSDKDGIIDSLDTCPHSPIGTIIDKNGCKINLELTIYFPNDSAIINENYIPEIGDVIKFLQEYPQYNVTIEAHTDSKGTHSYNFKLSEQRAEALYNRLIKNGIDSDRIKYYGYGETQPATSNATSKGMSLNRRIEVIFSK